MRKILFLIFLIIFSLFIYFPQTVSAAQCDFETDPNPPTQNMGDLKITIKSGDLTSGDKYYIILQLPNGNYLGNASEDLSFDPVAGVSYTFPKPTFGGRGWQEGRYKIYLFKSGVSYTNINQYECRKEDLIIGLQTQQSCTASIPVSPINPETEVKLRVANLSKKLQTFPDFTGVSGYNIIINDKSFKVYYKNTDGDDEITLGKFDTGTYKVEVKNRCGWGGINCPEPERLQCNCVGFQVKPFTTGGGGEISCNDVSQETDCKTLNENPGPGDIICTTSQAKAVGCPSNAISTAVGCIRTDPAGFTQDLLRFVLGIGGGLAFLMMLLGAFQMLTSAGNPETLNAGRERLTSAIIGLLIVIFAVLLLQIIGWDILKIPGFGK